MRTRDYDLARDAGDLLARLAKKKLPGAVKPEITESMIELNSSIQHGYAGAARGAGGAARRGDARRPAC